MTKEKKVNLFENENSLALKCILFVGQIVDTVVTKVSPHAKIVKPHDLLSCDAKLFAFCECINERMKKKLFDAIPSQFITSQTARKTALKQTEEELSMS